MQTSATRLDLFKGLALLGTIVSATLIAGKEWGSMAAAEAQRPVLMDRRDRETDALRQDIRDLRALLFDCKGKPQ